MFFFKFKNHNMILPMSSNTFFLNLIRMLLSHHKKYLKIACVIRKTANDKTLYLVLRKVW